MGRIRLIKHLRYVYSLLEGRTAHCTVLQTISCQTIGTGRLPQITPDYPRLPMLRYRWKTVESFSGTQQTHVTCRILPYSARVVKLTNHDFPSPGWKIAIGSLSTSALAALKIWLTASLEYYLESSLDGTSEEISYVFSFVFYGSIEAITETVNKWFHFSSTASV